jgi:two-component system chemotaxis response regulator CheB
VTLRIAICDDSPSYAAELDTFIGRDPGLEVVGVFRTAEDLLRAMDRLDPHLITLDLEMPGMGGMAAIERIMSRRPRPILVVSGHAADSDRAAQALAAGALEAIPKTALRLGEPDDLWATALRSRIKRLASVRLSQKPRGGRMGPVSSPTLSLDRPLRAIGIGTSTGGPPALAEVLGALPASFALPVLVVQHIAAGFGAGLVSWLDRQVAVPVAFAQDGEQARPGVWFAPEGYHLGLDRGGRFALDGETEHGAHRPSVDMLFESLASTLRDGALGVVLTGMGRDGALGTAAVKAAGGFTIAQDEATSAIYGMPRAAAEAGVDRVLPLGDIAGELRTLTLQAAAR